MSIPLLTSIIRNITTPNECKIARRTHKMFPYTKHSSLSWSWGHSATKARTQNRLVQKADSCPSISPWGITNTFSRLLCLRFPWQPIHKGTATKFTLPKRYILFCDRTMLVFLDFADRQMFLVYAFDAICGRSVAYGDF